MPEAFDGRVGWRVAWRRGRSRPPEQLIADAAGGGDPRRDLGERLGAAARDRDRRTLCRETSAIAAPMPVPPPVIKATLPSSSPTARLLRRERLDVAEPVVLALVAHCGPERLRGRFVLLGR